MTKPHRVASAMALMALVGCASAPRWPWPAAASAPPAHAEVRDLVPNYHPARSKVLLRQIDRPTRANLDWAAYHANAILEASDAPRTTGKAAIPLRDAFQGVLVPSSFRGALDQTPLSAAERQHPLAFSPMVDALAEKDAALAQGLQRARAAVREERFGLPRATAVASQEIADVYVRHLPGNAGAELWARVEFRPWARLFEAMPEPGAGGSPSVFAQLAPELASKEVFAWIDADYGSRALDWTGVRAWAHALASYWYPSYNTDLFDLEGSPRSPSVPVEPELAGALAKVGALPAVALRGQPQGEPLYNLFVISGVSARPTAASGGPKDAAPRSASTASPVHLSALQQQIESELAAHGGSWSAWEGEVAPAHASLRAALRRRPAALKALIGQDGWLFFRASLEYAVGGDLSAQPSGKNPFPIILEFKRFLSDLGVDLLLVPVPTKAEVYPERLGALMGGRAPAVLNPFARKLLLDLSRAGVEVVDLLPAFRKARAEDAPDVEPLYQREDTHWTSRGLSLAARLLAQRVREYPWWPHIRAASIPFQVKQSSFQRLGDLVSRLSDQEQVGRTPAPLVGQQVFFPDGRPYDDDPQSPVVLLGDSFTAVYQHIDCKHAGVSAQLAKELSLPVDLLMSYGGGPNVRNKLLRRGLEALRQKRVVIWMFSSRDLYHYWEDWAPLRLEQP
jgi:hypothetical protein